ncbi:MAG TPA: alpha-glucosidase, partial [Rhodospirillaceae bacterium]|nr:alpha-glucosidase [Rhodospirillaceae bacterium]
FSYDPRLSKMLIALLVCLRGTVFLYQGEELGLPEAKLDFNDLQDPWGKHLWPEWQGRDGCRTPMPWKNAPHAGFSTGKPWLPVPEEHKALSVDHQDVDPNSVLSFTRKFLRWRKTQPDLMRGDIDFIDTGNDKILAFWRGKMLCAFNLGDKEKSLNIDGKELSLAPYGFLPDANG